MDFVYVILGLLLLFGGGEALIRGSVGFSERLGISPVLIGVVIVGFGTSTPELLVSVQATLAGSPALALGNVVGSNIANVMLIMALAGIITTIDCRDPAIKRDALFAVAASVVLFGLGLTGQIGFAAGILMLMGILSYIALSYWYDRREHEVRHAAHAADHHHTHHHHHKGHAPQHQHETPEKDKAPKPLVSLSLAIGGIVLLVIGARLLVDGATSIARGFGVSEAVIGLSLVAVGTSLPELVAAVIGALKKQTDMVAGNILGSCMYNILGILGITSMISPVPVAESMATFDIPVMLGVAVLTAGIIFLRGQFGRVTGIVCLAAYGIYVWWMYVSGAITA